MTLACEDTNFKLVDTVILWCWWGGACWHQFGRDFDAEDCSRYRGWGLVNMLKLKFSWDFEAEVWLRFWSWILTNMWHGLRMVIFVYCSIKYHEWLARNMILSNNRFSGCMFLFTLKNWKQMGKEYSPCMRTNYVAIPLYDDPDYW